MTLQRFRRLPATFALGLLAWTAFLAPALGQTDAAPPEPPPAVVDSSIELDELTLRLVPLSREELAVVADAWFEIAKTKTQEVVEARLALVDGDEENVGPAREKLLELESERNALFDGLLAVLSSWERKGGDEDRIGEYRMYRSAVILEQTRTADVQTLARQFQKWALSTDGGLRLLLRTLVVVAALFALLILARVARRIAARAAGRLERLSKLLQTFLAVTVYWVVVAIGLMIVLSALGVDVSPIFALIGGASFILAFALQSTLGNLAAGLMIMVNRPFDEGDFVDIGGVAGTVKTVNIVSTRIATPDNRIILVPNSNVWGNVITNVTTSPTRRVDLTFGIGYDDDIETAQRVLEETVAKHPMVLGDPAPVIRVGELADSSVNFVVRPWVKGADYWAVYWDLTRQVKEAFDASGISIPFPQQDVHVRDVPRPGGDDAPTKSET